MRTEGAGPSALKLLSQAGTVLTIVYPFALFTLRDHHQFSLIALSLGGLLILNLLLKLKLKQLYRLGAVLLVIALAGLLRLLELPHEMRLYPFLMSLAMLMLFVLTKDPEENPMLGPLRDHAAKNRHLLLALHQAKVIWIAGLSLNTLALFVFLFGFSTESWVMFASFYSYLWLLSLLLLSIAYVSLRTWRKTKAQGVSGSIEND